MRLSPGLDRLSAYRVPRHPAPVDLRLDGNEGAYPPRSVLLPSTRAAEVTRGYPDAAALESALAGRLGIDPGRVIVTAGGDDALCRILRLVAEPGREVVLPGPSFEMIRKYASLHGLAVREVDWSGPTWPREPVLNSIGPETAAIAVVTPNNPTGATASVEDLEQVSAAARGALVILDQAYAEYDDDHATIAALALPNVVTVRSMSKAWGLAGLRIGYAIGPVPIVERLRAVGQPYAVSGPSIAVALRALASGEDWMRAHVERVRFERDALATLLRSVGARPRPSSANFVLADFDDPSWPADALAGLGIGVRRFPGTSGLERSLRITCPGTEDGYARLARGLRAALAPEAVLLDMDGVLADASGSYRAAIVGTAAGFGARVTPENITRVKAAGNANNDWDVTWRVLRDAGVEVAYDAVVRAFERRYHGTDGEPGLKATERLIPGRETLERIRALVPLAIVTGRPARDAREFLDRFEIADLFDAVVTMEDGPAKPDPAPVRMALDRLGIASAWFVGDTPDDVVAAREAGAVPIGVVAPGDSPEMTGVLLRSGAARVVEGVEQVGVLLEAALDDGDR